MGEGLGGCCSQAGMADGGGTRMAEGWGEADGLSIFGVYLRGW